MNTKYELKICLDVFLRQSKIFAAEFSICFVCLIYNPIKLKILSELRLIKAQVRCLIKLIEN